MSHYNTEQLLSLTEIDRDPNKNNRTWNLLSKMNSTVRHTHSRTESVFEINLLKKASFHERTYPFLVIVKQGTTWKMLITPRSRYLFNDAIEQS